MVRDIKNALGYIDNPLVHTDTYKKHLKVLDQILSNLVKYIIIFYGFLKNESMWSCYRFRAGAAKLSMQGTPTLWNSFFKQIGHYTATSTFIHIRIFLNVSQVFETKQVNADTYK